MTDENTMPPSTINPSGPDTTNETTPPTQQEIQKLVERMLGVLTEENETQLSTGVMRSMSEAQRQHYSATNQDPLVRFIYQKAEHEIINRRAERQARNVQTQQWQQQQQQQTPNNPLPPLVLRPRINAFTPPSTSTAAAPSPYNLLLAEAAINLAQAALAAPVHVPPDDKCANCGGVAKQHHIGRVDDLDEQGKESLPLNYCSRNCQRGHWASI